MQSEPFDSKRLPAEWSGARVLVEKWLKRSCVAESIVNLFGSVFFTILGFIALVLTSIFSAGIVFVCMMGVYLLLGAFGMVPPLSTSATFIILFLLFLLLTVVHAVKTRWDSDSAANVDFDTALASLTSTFWEFISAGPILFVIAAQDLRRFFRLTRIDGPQVSALLLWLYDRGCRAGFAEISIAFPGLNAVRVLPQLRDIPGIYWWPGEGEISISDSLQTTFEEILGRKPKTSPYFSRFANAHEQSRQPMPEADNEAYQWYAILGLPAFATLPQVKARYRKLAKIYHPDARSGAKTSGETVDDEQMKRINEAYHQILKNSDRQAGIAP